MPVFIKVSQNKIKDSKSFGKWYGRVATTKTMTYQELCKHMSEHNSVYGEDVCLGVANKLQTCMLEQLLEGKKVQFGELGVFYLSVKSTGANKEEDFNLGINIQGLYLCFAPSRTDVNNLSSKMLKKKASFLNVKDMVVSKTKSSGNSQNSGSGNAGSENSGSGSGPAESAENAENNGGSGSNTNGENQSGENQNQQNSVAAPVISGTTPFESTTEVSISGPDGATIYYSENGDDPDTNDTLYTQPFTIDETTTVKAIAIKDGVSSQVTTKVFTKGSGGSGGFETGS